MLDNNFIDKYGIDVKFEYKEDTNDSNQEISAIIADAFEKFVEKEINKI